MLIGDAASCVSLLAGEGTGLAMIEAYVLAGELYHAGKDFREAFRRHEQRLRSFIEAKQKSAPEIRPRVRSEDVDRRLDAQPGYETDGQS